VLADIGPNREQHALTLVVAGAVLVGFAEIACDDRSLYGAHDLAQGYLSRGPGEDVPPTDTPLRAHQPGALQSEENLLQVGLGQPGALCDVAHGRGLRLAGVKCKRQQSPARVIAPGGYLHLSIVPLLRFGEAEPEGREGATQPGSRVSGMRSPSPVLPDYEGANLAGLLPALSLPPGERPAWLPATLATAEQVVLLVVDGLGWLQLQERSALAPCLSSMQGGPITSVVPSTTATALTSITVGEPPARHGVVGYKLAVEGPSGPEVMNVLRWRTPSGDARGFVDPGTFQPLEPFGGRPIPVVSKAEFSGTGFSVAHQRGAHVAGMVAASSLAVEVRRLVAGGAPLVYAYYEGVDKVAHYNGFGAHYDAELEAVDEIVQGLLAVIPAGVALAVTADHGQVEVGERARELDEEVTKRSRMVSGEARFRWLHAGGESETRVKELASVAADLYGQEAWVVTIDEVEGEGWLGGPLEDRVRARLGDVAIVAHAPVGFLARAETTEPLLRCRHGSLTAEEMFVPLVSGRGRLVG
jgi:hypothetical protein